MATDKEITAAIGAITAKVRAGSSYDIKPWEAAELARGALRAAEMARGAESIPSVVSYAQELERKIEGLHRIIGEMEADRRLRQ